MTNLKRCIPLRTVWLRDAEGVGDSSRSPVRCAASHPTLPPRKIGDTWEYRTYNIADNRINRTWTITVTDIRGDTIKLRRVDNVDPPSESEEKIGEIYPDRLVPGLEWRRSRTIEGKEFWSSYKAQSWVAIRTASGSCRAMRVDGVFTHPKGLFDRPFGTRRAPGPLLMLHYHPTRATLSGHRTHQASAHNSLQFPSPIPWRDSYTTFGKSGHSRRMGHSCCRPASSGSRQSASSSQSMCLA